MCMAASRLPKLHKNNVHINSMCLSCTIISIPSYRSIDSFAATMSQTVWFLALLLFLFSRSALSEPVTEPSCSIVIQDVFPCLDFVDGTSKDPSAACCSGVKSISNMGKDKAGRKAICECLKNTLTSFGAAYDPNLVSQLPKKCKVPIAIPPIKGDTDCTRFIMSTTFGLG